MKTVISYCHFWKNDEYGAYDLGRIGSVAGGLGVAVMTLGCLEKLGNSYQVPQKDPCFVYISLFYTALSLFHAGFVL